MANPPPEDVRGLAEGPGTGPAGVGGSEFISTAMILRLRSRAASSTLRAILLEVVLGDVEAGTDFEVLACFDAASEGATLSDAASMLDMAEGALVDRSAKLTPGSRADTSTSSKESSAKREPSSGPILQSDSSVREWTTGSGAVLVEPGDSTLTGTAEFVGLGGLTGVALEANATLYLESHGAGARGSTIGHRAI
jgi:hypothetical protein